MNKQTANRGKHMQKLNLRQLRQAASESAALPPSMGMADENRPAVIMPGSKPQDVPLNTQFLFQMIAHLQPPLVLERAPLGTRQIISTVSGQIDGPSIRGELLPGTTDWPYVRTDGVAVLDARVTVRLDDTQLLYLSYPGYFIVSPEVWERILAGETVAPSDYYFRVTMRFETGSEQYGWLNQIMAVGVGEVGPGFTSVSYRAYQVL